MFTFYIFSYFILFVFHFCENIENQLNHTEFFLFLFCLFLKKYERSGCFVALFYVKEIK